MPQTKLLKNISVAVECIQSKSVIASFSAIKICPHLILSHSSLVSKFVKHFFKSSETTVNPSASENKISQYLQSQDIAFKIYTDDFSKIDIGYLKSFLLNPITFNSFYHLLTGTAQWTFDKNIDCKEATLPSILAVLLSSFVLIEIESSTSENCLQCLNRFEQLISEPTKGEVVYIDGCPFGSNAPALFLNSVSRGIIGNVSLDQQIFLTDARCSLGCEGAPVYSVKMTNRNVLSVCGIVVSPFCWLKGEWIGLSYVASLAPVIELAKNYLGVLPDPRIKFDPKIFKKDQSYSLNKESLHNGLLPNLCSMDYHNLIPKLFSGMRDSVVRVHSKDAKIWGSGVIVEASGIVLTCAHVVAISSDEKIVHVSLSGGCVVEGRVLFASPLGFKEGGETLYARDVAVIKIPPQREFLPLTKFTPRVGCELVIGGFPFFPKSVHDEATFSSGNLAKVYESSNFSGENVVRPFLLQTTCPVYAGISGAPVVALHDQEGVSVVGVMTCCVKDDNNAAHFPSLSFATPSWLLAEAVDKYVRNQDENQLKAILLQRCRESSVSQFFYNKLKAKI